MRKFTDNTALLKHVSENNVTNIRHALINNIFFLGGDQTELWAATEYAEKNSDFTFDVYQELPIASVETPTKEFSLEKLNLLSNYSEERYKNLIELYHKAYGSDFDDEKIEKRYLLPRVNTALIVSTLIIGSALLLYSSRCSNDRGIKKKSEVTTVIKNR